MSKRRMRIALLNSTIFGRHCLEKGILPLPEVEVVGILTTPKQIEISYSENPVEIKTHATFDDLAKQAGCEVALLRGKINTTSYLDYLKQWQPDLLCALGWYYMIPRKVRDLAPLGCVGIHASLLPKYRGGAPIPWAIINGEQETGVSFFYLEDGVDNGDIIGQVKFPIKDEDDCSTIYAKATRAAISLLRDFLPQLKAGTAPRIPQDESQATYYPQRKPEDGLIDWSWSAKRIRDFIRAQTRPYPGAFMYIQGKKITIWDADIVEVDGDYSNLRA